MLRTLVVAAALFAASPALAGAWSKGCQFTGGDLVGTIGTPVNTSTSLDKLNFGCYRFNNADSTHNSPLITVAGQALIVFDPQLDAAVTVATTALVIPHFCPAWAALTTANPERSCISLGGVGSATALDGVEGAIGTQNAAVRVGPGVYYFQVSGACLAGDTCQVSIQVEDAAW